MEHKIVSAFLGLILAVVNLSGCINGQNSSTSEMSGSLKEIITRADNEGIVGEKTSAAETIEKDISESQSNEKSDSEEKEVEKMILKIGENSFTATLEDNDAVKALTDMMSEAPIVIQMSDYSGFEKVGSLGTNLPTYNKQTTTKSGDIVLYNGDQIVIFYGSNSWSYTRLGKIDDLTGWEDALGSGDVTVTFSLGNR